jgi:hypothetical protein
MQKPALYLALAFHIEAFFNYSSLLSGFYKKQPNEMKPPFLTVVVVEVFVYTASCCLAFLPFLGWGEK